MWYDNSYNASIQILKNSIEKLSEKEYRNIAKKLNLLSPESLSYITGLKFIELIKNVRNKKASHTDEVVKNEQEN